MQVNYDSIDTKLYEEVHEARMEEAMKNRFVIEDTDLLLSKWLEKVVDLKEKTVIKNREICGEKIHAAMIK